MQFLSLYESYFKQSLSETQVQTLKILVWLLTVQKTVKIERLAACFPLPIKYESRRRHIQRFLTLFSLSFPLFWFPIIMMILSREFSDDAQLILTFDRHTKSTSHAILVKRQQNYTTPETLPPCIHQRPVTTIQNTLQ
ncbi:hypothetical protein [Okeania sp. SIO2C9]|uniref:hypothetical protein n=1 Tax=Okeania sp. SIO2C9 TaxID=2607791 RepID=UPI0025F98881|nr:hypothetical protein [Okeania sp. SIO2C9]